MSIAEDALERERRALAGAMTARDEAASHLTQCVAAHADAVLERAREISEGITESTFAEHDAWIRAHEGRIARAERGLKAADEGVAAAHAKVREANMRAEQMRILRERGQAQVRTKEARAERRSEDERLAPRATTK